MRRRKNETVLQRLIREMKQSPLKAGVLGIGAIIAAVVWGPLLVAGGKAKTSVVAAGLEADGFLIYRWRDGPDPLLRLVTAFSTAAADVDRFIATAARHAGGS